MKKYLILLSLLLALFACDRFDHNFEPDVQEENYIIDFFSSFSNDVETILPAEDVSDIMAYYHEDYSNNGLSKSDVETFYQSFYIINTALNFEISLVDTNDLVIDWRLIATELDSETTYMDTVISDVLIETEDSYKFYGNQANLRNVLVELFTGQWCSNCPNAEEALHEINSMYGSRFSYVEYHVGDLLAGDFAEIYGYYPSIGTLPFGIVNGNEEIIYSAPSVEDVLTEIENAIVPLLQETPEVILADVQAEIADNTLSGSVNVTLEPSVPSDDLTLVAVLMENYNPDYPNHDGDPHTNIALKRIEVDISTLNLEEPVSFDIEDLDILPQWYIDNGGILPEDLTLMLWVQTLETDYNEDSCEVYNVIEIPIN